MASVGVRSAVTSAASRPRPDVIPPGVLPGHDGWLFFVGNPTLIRRLYSRHPLTLWLLYRWRALILRRVSRARGLGCRYVQFIVPDKLSIHRDKLDAPFPPGSMSPGRRLGQLLPREVKRDNWIDAFAVFEKAGREEDLYYRSDTHWSARGYMLGYSLLCRALDVSPAAHVLAASVQSRSMVMDIASKCEPVIEEPAESHVFTARAERISENELVTFREANPNHVVGTSFGSRIVLRNVHSGVDPRTVVVFGDSNLFHPTGLGAMLAESFREVHMLWSSRIDWAYVERVKPAILVHELSERFLRRRPTDGFDIEAFARERLDAARRADIPATDTVMP